MASSTGCCFPGHPGAVPQRITPNGDVYGCLHDLDTGMSMYGAIWYRDGSVASLMTAGGELSDLTVDVSMSMNNGATPGGRVIVGLFNDAVRRHGFIVQDGVFYAYDVPSATIKLTAIWDINPRGQFVGTYVDGTGRHGFLQNPDGSAPVQVDVTGQTNTIVMGINPERRDRRHVYYRLRHAWIHRCADSGRAITPECPGQTTFRRETR